MVLTCPVSTLKIAGIAKVVGRSSGVSPWAHVSYAHAAGIAVHIPYAQPSVTVIVATSSAPVHGPMRLCASTMHDAPTACIYRTK